jgi:uncharacterized protein
MTEGLLQLLELQEIDKELQTLEDAKEQYPSEISSRQRGIERAQKALKAHVDGLQEADRKQRQLELDLEAAKSSLKEHEARFAEVTNNREYDALQIEIESCRTRIADCETQILELIDTSETLRQQVEEERGAFEEVQGDQQQRIDELQQKLASLQEEVDKVTARRNGFAEDQDPALVRLYEGSRKRRGTRVAAVRKGACGGCFRELPAQHRSNVRRNQEAYFCEHCGALLVWDGSSN